LLTNSIPRNVHNVDPRSLAGVQKIFDVEVIDEIFKIKGLGRPAPYGTKVGIPFRIGKLTLKIVDEDDL
jgi:hypothetical protein